ncbi:hypothetical protein [Peribacillus simplex]|uniref:hypothetical protein n=1 Tax=Peribacillus simplex TaxID=1478 RepID=UPI0024C13E15|nr:hypothetical protein [Peribacillus simplex]MDR4926251.1 hypothetical protein [Peribacillus simplex]WHX89131.1 hypothetical protein QNH50_13615 [Peribacillus simplex]
MLGICEPNALSDYERSITSPTIDELALFTDKLKVDLPYFFTTKNEPIYNYIEIIKFLINKYKRTRNYGAIYEIVQKEMATAPEKSISFYQFLKWHEGISFFYLYNDKQRAIELLNEAIKIFNEAMEFIENIPHVNQEGSIILKIIHGLAQTLTELHYYLESLNYTLKGINICNSIESLYLYAELHLLTGKNLVHLQQPEKGLHYIKQSKNIFSLQKNEEFIRIAEHELESILQCLCTSMDKKR